MTRCGFGHQAIYGLSKEEASTRDTVTAYREYKQVLQNIVDAEEMIKEIRRRCGLGRNGQARAQRCQG